MNVSGLTLARVVRLRRQNRTGGHSFLHQNAVKLIRNEENPAYDLLLQVPTEEI
jgi:hypothetical protein